MTHIAQWLVDVTNYIMHRIFITAKYHSEAPASPEQRGAYRSTSASTVRRQLAAPDASLVAS